ncbi:MAG: 4-hydroxythreonine-4-phosphate dehydrogenase PdxA, partial [Muribaculaceae bacterium]|nr:4-hydroxythreonine-4-phosphate dehydrogenase PdxA [Muribaculaceae bacterium]
ALMILASENIRVALVNAHVPLREVAPLITKEAVEARIMQLHHSLCRDFGIPSPRIAVLALNPHSGEEGLLGTEEQEHIAPAIEAARNRKALCFGPYPADGFWGSDAYTHFDGVVAMYHDQGLAPFKALEMNEGVNFTAGLPFVRTSPDHGTAYDIAGKNQADPESMRQAVYMAIDIFRNRRNHDDITRNPLRKQYFEKGNDNVVLDLTKEE